MAKFKTASGHSFRLKITIPRIKAIRDEFGLDIGILDDFMMLPGDLPQLVDVLYLLCEKQCKKIGMSDVEFGESLCGDSLEHAWEALERAYLAFCPSRRRKIVKLALAKIHQAVEDLETSTLSVLATRSGECSE